VQYVFYGLRGRQTQGPPRAAHTLATSLQVLTSEQEMPSGFPLEHVLV